MIKKLFTLNCLLVLTFSLHAAEKTIATIASPNGAIKFQAIDDSGQLKFAVTSRGQPVIQESPMQFSLDGIDLTSGARFGEEKNYSLHETYPWRGVHSIAGNFCNGALILCKHGET